MHSPQDVIKSINHGHKESFKEFFDEFYPILCVFAKKFLKSTDKSKDVAQESLIKFWEKRKEFNDLQGAKSFLYVITKNKCINILKKSSKTTDISSLKELESESFLKKNVINLETFQLVRNAVNSLPGRQKEIIELSMKGLKNPEIALQLGISAHTVHSSKKVAYRKLRSILKNNYYLLLFL